MEQGMWHIRDMGRGQWLLYFQIDKQRIAEVGTLEVAPDIAMSIRTGLNRLGAVPEAARKMVAA
jgi:hypothetical protein